jgi:aminoglycoside 6'-N-acetyltransferase
MRLRPAKPSDLALLRYWNTKPHVVAATGGDANWDWEAELAHVPEGRELLIAEVDGRPLGFIQIMDPARDETHYWGEAEPGLRAIDIWIGEEADLGRGFGREMMRLALDRCFAEQSVEAVLLDPLASNTRAHRFYERLGFEAVDRRMFGTDDCLVHRLERDVWHARDPRL